MSIEPDLVAERVAQLRETVDRHATRPVTIVAITKRFGLDAVQAALAAGVADVGENYAQELAGKAVEFASMLGPGDSGPRWHFVGHVQRNKVRMVADHVVMWHSVDSLKLGKEIAKRAPGASIMVQVNASGASSQSGVAFEDLDELVAGLRAEDVVVSGLMAIGANDDATANPRLFRHVRERADALGLEHCSMGMSGDLEAALEAGSTMIRIGTGLFGPRPPR